MRLSKLLRIPAAILLCFSILTFALAAWTFLSVRSDLASAVHRTGEVIALKPVPSRNARSTLYRPRLRFLDESGHPHEFDASFASHPAPHQVGDQLLIVHPPGSPDQARVATFSGLWLAPTLLLGLSLASLVSLAILIAAQSAIPRLMTPSSTHTPPHTSP